jgi:cell division protein FtsQ
MRRLTASLDTRRQGGWSRVTTRSALVFLVAGGLGLAYLSTRAPTLTGLLDADGDPVTAVPETEPAPPVVAEPATPSRTSEILAQQGLVLDQITVVGRRVTDARDLLDAVGVGQGAPLMAIDPEAVRTRLLTLPWVLTARVERRLPSRLHIDITEREPLALWQYEGAYKVIDRQGVAVDADPATWAHLPLVVGAGAGARAADLLNLLTTQPAIAARVKAAILVGERRWTLRLDDVEKGLALRLPALDPADALAKIAELDATEGLLSKDLAMIDMRLPGRLVVRLVDHDKTDEGPLEGEGVTAQTPTDRDTPSTAGGRDA